MAEGQQLYRDITRNTIIRNSLLQTNDSNIS